MPWIIYIYWMFSLVIVITAYTDAGWQAALSALAGIGFAFIAGAGLKGSLYGTKAQKLVLDCDNTRYVIPTGLKRESIDFPGYPLSRV